MALAAGDSFFAPWPEEDAVIHLFFVISSPEKDMKRVVVVPLMTWDEYKESTCTLEPGEHPFVRHKSYIDFGCAAKVDGDEIDKKIRSNEFRKHKPASVKLLKKIRDGAGKSEYLALGLRDILEDQDLVDQV